jgi:DHA1 family multidrug resistance protein-like MFS transporter
MWNYAKSLFGNLSPGVRSFIATESLFGIGAGIFSLILNLHLLKIGFDEKLIGQITSLGALTVGVLSLPAGLLVRRIGRKSMLVTGMVLLFISLIGFGIGISRTAVIAAQLVWSIGVTAIVNSEIQLIFQYCKNKNEETRAYSLLFAIFTLFVGVGTLLGGYLPVWIGGSSSVYQYSFFVAAAFLAMGALLRALLLPGTKSVNQSVQHPSKIPALKQRKLKSFPFLLMLSLLIFTSGFTFGMLSPFLNVIIKFRFSWSDESISILLTASGFFFFLGSISMPYLIERWGSRVTFNLLFAANTVFALLLGLSVPGSIFSVLLLLRGGVFTMLNNLLDSEAMSAVDEQDRNLFAGMRTVSRSVGNAIAAYWAGIIMSGNNYTLPFLITAASVVVGFLGYAWYVQPMLERRHRPHES